MAPRQQRGALKLGLTELFSGLFYVAASRFNSPRQLSKRIEAYLRGAVNAVGAHVTIGNRT